MVQCAENIDTTNTTRAGLEQRHYEEIHDESCVADDVIAERGYYTVRTKAELDRLGFSRGQQLAPGIAMPIHDPRGEQRFVLYKPDEPRMDKKTGRQRKYEFPAKTQMTLDVPARCREKLGDPSVPVIFTEGVKKADALASLGLCVCNVIGVWNWRGTNDKGGKAILPDLEYVAFKNQSDRPRKVFLIFDSDIMQKPEVYNALKRLRDVL